MSRPENRMHTEKSAVCILFFGSVEVYSAGTVIPEPGKKDVTINLMIFCWEYTTVKEKQQQS